MSEAHSAKICKIEEAIAENAKKVFPADLDPKHISRIAYEADMFVALNRSSPKAWREADKNVAEAAKKLRTALEQSAENHETLSIILGADCRRKLAEVERAAMELVALVAPPKPGRPPYRRLERVCDVVLDAYWNAAPTKIGLLGTNKRDPEETFGRAGDIVKAALIAAGAHRLPSASTINNAMKDAADRKISGK